MFEMSEKNQTKSKESNAGRGGRRAGAGRKTGSATKKTREIADAAAAEGITPLEFMLNVMRSEPPADLEGNAMVAAMTLRFEAAKAAAPYMHPRLASVEVAGPNQGPIQTQTANVTPEQLAETVRSVRSEF